MGKKRLLDLKLFFEIEDVLLKIHNVSLMGLKVSVRGQRMCVNNAITDFIYLFCDLTVLA